MRFINRLTVTLFTITFSNFAHAHSGFDSGYLAGFAHPLLGIDHALAMLAVGLWAYQMGGRSVWLVPTSFLILMTISGIFSTTGLAMPMIESGIATTVLLVGLLITFAIKIAPVYATIIVGLFAVFHGYAHAAEIPQQGSHWHFIIGFILSTALLNSIGVLLGFGFKNNRLWLRASGLLLASSGAWLMASM